MTTKAQALKAFTTAELAVMAEALSDWQAEARTTIGDDRTPVTVSEETFFDTAGAGEMFNYALSMSLLAGIATELANR